MNNFNTFTPISGGHSTTSPNLFSAHTDSSLLDATTEGFLDAQKEFIKDNDYLYVFCEDKNGGEPRFSAGTINKFNENFRFYPQQPIFLEYNYDGGSTTVTITHPFINGATEIVTVYVNEATTPASITKATPYDNSNLILELSNDPGPGTRIIYAINIRTW